MPQPQNLKEQFEPERLPVGWPWRLFTITLVIFLGILLSYLGLTFGYEPFLLSQIEEKESAISQLAVSVSREDQDKLVSFYSQLINLKTLLDNHGLPSKLFSFIEQITHRRVVYTNATAKVTERQLELSGIAESYAVLAEQLESFNQSKDIERYALNQSQLNNGLVQFKATLTFKNSIIK